MPSYWFHRAMEHMWNTKKKGASVMQDLLVCACAVQCVDGTFCNRLSVCTSCIPAINLGRLHY